MVDKRLKILGPALLAGIMLTVSGCVSKRIDQGYVPVATTQNSEGLVTLSWPSRKGYNYRLVARDYQKHEMAVSKKVYPGTGGTITIQFKRDPKEALPDYSARPEKVSGK